MLSGVWLEVVALVATFAIAAVTTPPSPSVTPANLLCNVVASPGAIWRYWRQGQTGGTLTRLLLAGTLPVWPPRCERLQTPSSASRRPDRTAVTNSW